ncbi:hypothetical protein HY605_03745 [Candidatus Peregrinibacteria bacterium]|nr:hypothetical protein [Candidatus Peregrinibacteria bacterium]
MSQGETGTQVPPLERPLEAADMQALAERFNEGVGVLNQARDEMLMRADRAIAASPFGPLLRNTEGGTKPIALTHKDLDGFGYKAPEAIDPATGTVRYCFHVNFDAPKINAAIQAALEAGYQVDPQSLSIQNGPQVEYYESFEVKIPLSLLGRQPAASALAPQGAPDSAVAEAKALTVEVGGRALYTAGC